MAQTYTQRKKVGAAPERAASEAKGPSIRQLAAGAAPSATQMGSRVDLPGEIREKMENSFGADFSNVKLFESQTVADAGAQAVTQGNNIAFAPGQLDLTSTAGQALLGHELSHVVSQARGESAGQGFLNDSHLEAQADTQGMLAAQGQSAYSGPVSPIGASSAVSAAGPMQAKKPPRTKDGTDVSEFAGEEALQISEPQIDQAKMGALNAESEKIRSGYIKGTTDQINSSADSPAYWQNFQTWEKGMTGVHENRLYGRDVPIDDDFDDAWNDIHRGGYTWRPREGSEDKAINGMTRANFLKGVRNARERRGLSN